MASERWTREEALSWYAARPTPRGTNFHPSTAANWIEVWQDSTFDEATITRELSLGSDVGFNSIRMFLPFIVWEHDPEGLKGRINRVLELADANGMTLVVCLFDDCNPCDTEPRLGPRKLTPGRFVSTWAQSPGERIVSDRARWPTLREYVADVVGSFCDDERVLLWDLYNEPRAWKPSIELVRATFEWAREANPTQPLTSGVWLEPEPDNPHYAPIVEFDPGYAECLPVLNELLLDLSDVVSFHSYLELPAFQRVVDRLAEHGRPIVCTEWMARELNTFLHTHLPVFAASDPPIGWFVWGLVTGRMQTHINPLGNPEGPYARPWRHDFFWPDETPYDREEIELLRAAAQTPGATRAI